MKLTGTLLKPAIVKATYHRALIVVIICTVILVAFTITWSRSDPDRNLRQTVKSKIYEVVLRTAMEKNRDPSRDIGLIANQLLTAQDANAFASTTNVRMYINGCIRKWENPSLDPHAIIAFAAFSDHSGRSIWIGRTFDGTYRNVGPDDLRQSGTTYYPVGYGSIVPLKSH